VTTEEQAESETVDHQLADRAEPLVIDAGGVIGAVAWSWFDGRRAVTVSVKHDVDRFPSCSPGSSAPTV
jgi:hypothetical protein